MRTADTGEDLTLARSSAGWESRDAWRSLRILSEFVDGFEELSDLPPSVSVFGSARSADTDYECSLAENLGGALARAGFAVITGGDPGVMAAANRGAALAGGLSVGLGIKRPLGQGLNEWVSLGVDFRFSFVRKVMFLKYAQGFVLLPGGFGTMDQLFEALSLVQTRTVTHFPIVLLGTAYWRGLLTWIRHTMLAEDKVSKDDLDLILLTDDVVEAVAHMVNARERLSSAHGGGRLVSDDQYSLGV